MTLEKPINWAILVTGWGKNAYDIIQAYGDGQLKKSTIKLLIYEEEPCGAHDLAKEYQIESLQIIKSDFNTSRDYQQYLIKQIQSKNIDYILLLNYKYIIKEDMLASFPNRMINIHPSLFPSFLGTKTAIQEALDYGVKITGITTHIIDDQVDKGLILKQEAIKIKTKDTFESLYPKFAKKGKKILLKTIDHIEKSHFKK